MTPCHFKGARRNETARGAGDFSKKESVSLQKNQNNKLFKSVLKNSFPEVLRVGLQEFTGETLTAKLH